jgi:hypothetical protein
MAQNKVMNLWTAFVTAFLALCTALGLITTTASAAVPQTETARNSTPETSTTPAVSPWSWAYDRSLPPTMKQRIRAEAHGKTPSCRHRPATDVDMDVETDAKTDADADVDAEVAQDAADFVAGPVAPKTPAQHTTVTPAGDQAAISAQATSAMPAAPSTLQDTAPCAPAGTAAEPLTLLQH